jgi:hypothetical protein
MKRFGTIETEPNIYVIGKALYLYLLHIPMQIRLYLHPKHLGVGHSWMDYRFLTI